MIPTLGFAGLLALGVSTTVASAPAATAAHFDRAGIDHVLDHALKQQRVVGAVVLVSQNGHLIYHHAAGFADREAQRPMHEDAVFRLASISKPIVTAAALRLVQQGKLDLQAPVTRWLPDFTPRLPDGRTPSITLHQLLTHSAGLGYAFEEPADGPYHRLGISDGLDLAGIDLDENLRRLAKAPLYFEPGSAWRYSLGLDVIGKVIEQVTGKPLAEAVAELVTTPLHMRDSGFVARDPARLAVPYADGKPPIRMTDNIEVPLPKALGYNVRFAPARAIDADAFPSGGAGMVGTAADVMRLLEAVRKNGDGMLAPGTVAQMFRAQVGEQAQTQGPGWGFGYGGAVLVDPKLAQTPQSKGTLQWGGAYGHYWFVDPARGLSVVMLTDTAFEGMSGKLTFELRDAVYAALNAKRR